jgi:hypothetical protein
MLPAYQNNQKCARSVILTFTSRRLFARVCLDFAENALFFQKIPEGTATMNSFVRTFGFHLQSSVLLNGKMPFKSFLSSGLVLNCEDRVYLTSLSEFL